MPSLWQRFSWRAASSSSPCLCWWHWAGCPRRVGWPQCRCPHTQRGCCWAGGRDDGHWWHLGCVAMGSPTATALPEIHQLEAVQNATFSLMELNHGFFLPFFPSFFFSLLFSWGIVMLFCFSYLYILPASAGPDFSTAQLLPLRLPSPGLFCDKTSPFLPWLYLQGCELSELRAMIFFS